ncbi:MAG: hypothetical protein JSV40_11535, partial [Deltaproteobacteria bacterium]
MEKMINGNRDDDSSRHRHYSWSLYPLLTSSGLEPRFCGAKAEPEKNKTNDWEAKHKTIVVETGRKFRSQRNID